MLERCDQNYGFLEQKNKPSWACLTFCLTKGRWQRNSLSFNDFSSGFLVRFPSPALCFDFSSAPYGDRLGLGSGTAKKQPPQGFFVERKQRPEIAEASKGRSSRNGQQDQHRACKKSRKPEKACGEDQKNPVYAQSIRKIRSVDGQGGEKGYGRIKQNLCGGPVQAYGNIPDDQSADQGKGARKFARA